MKWEVLQLVIHSWEQLQASVSLVAKWNREIAWPSKRFPGRVWLAECFGAVGSLVMEIPKNFKPSSRVGNACAWMLETIP